MNTPEENFNLIKKEIIKGTLQERLGYDVYDKVLNHSWGNLPEKSREKFLKFLEKEGDAIALSGTVNKGEGEVMSLPARCINDMAIANNYVCQNKNCCELCRQ